MKVRSIINLSLIAAAVLLLIFGTMPLYDEGGVVESTIPVRQQELEDKQRLKRRLDDLRATLGVIEQEAERIEAVVPVDSDVPELIVSLETITGRNGMVLRNVRFGQSTGDLQFVSGGGSAASLKEYATLQISMGISGSYEALEGFLRDLEHNLRIIDVTSISFASSDESTELNTFEFSLEAEAYYLR